MKKMDQARQKIADGLISTFGNELFHYNIHKKLDDMKLNSKGALFFFDADTDEDMLFNILLHKFPENGSMFKVPNVGMSKGFIRVLIQY